MPPSSRSTRCWPASASAARRSGVAAARPVMSRLIGIATACGLGLATLAVALYAWLSMVDAELDIDGYVALTLGIVATLVLGALLVGLMLYSNRRGYDDRAGAPFSDREKLPPEEE